MASNSQLALPPPPGDQRAAASKNNQLDKWGTAGRAGYQIVPNVLIRAQRHLGLDATDLVVLLNLTLHWWGAQSHPFPSASIIAKRMGVSRRTVERRLGGLEKKGFIKKLLPSDGTMRRRYDLSGMVKKLEPAAEIGLVRRNFAKREAARV